MMVRENEEHSDPT